MKYGRRLAIPLLVLVTLLVFLTQGQVVQAGAITVTTTDDELNADGDCSLREAIQAANTDTAVDACTAGSGADTISVPAGTYTLSIAGFNEDANATGDFDITDDLSITGSGEATTIIDGASLDRIFDIRSSVTAYISGLTMQNGSANFGGGIYLRAAATLTLDSSTLTGNTATSSTGGGGIYMSFAAASTLILINSTVSDNTATGDGGGIKTCTACSVTLTDSAVSGNTTTNGTGGGIENLGTLILDNTTVSGNTAAGAGGGIHSIGSGGLTVTISNSTFSGNNAHFGGGIFSRRGTLDLTDSTVSGNTASIRAGGIANQANTMTINNSTIIGNTVTAGDGGGIDNEDTGALLTITNSTVSGNMATGEGGGILNLTDAILVLNDSTVSGNSAGGNGGGIAGQLGTTITVNNSTVSGNSAGGDGGGTFNRFNSVTLILNNSTLSGNSAGGSGGGINGDAGTVTLKNTIVANSPSGGDCSGIITSLGHNLDSDGSCGLAATGDLSSTDPLLGPLENNHGPTLTHRLLGGSPAINAGSPDCPPPATDQRGITRPQEAVCDIGAVEVKAGFVGGVTELPEIAASPLEVPDSSGSNTGITLLAGVAGAVAAGTLTLSGAAWYARRRGAR